MKKIRGFEIAKGFEDKGINLPIRKTSIYARRWSFIFIWKKFKL